MITKDNTSIELIFDTGQYCTTYTLESLHSHLYKTIGYRFEYLNKYGIPFDHIEFRDIPCRKVVEEMIHRCLPSPFVSLDKFYNDEEDENDNALWMDCFYNLLKDWHDKG